MTKTVDANSVCAKTVSIYAAQVLLGAIAIAAGAAKLSGTGVLVHQFQLLGIGQVFLTIAGTVEIAAGLCLLLPRGGILGAVLLAGVMIGALGITLGHVASAVAQPQPAASLTSTGFQSMQSSRPDGGMIQIIRPRTEWDV